MLIAVTFGLFGTLAVAGIVVHMFDRDRRLSRNVRESTGGGQFGPIRKNAGMSIPPTDGHSEALSGD